MKRSHLTKAGQRLIQPLNISNLAGTYHLSDLTVRVGDGLAESIFYLFGNDAEGRRLIRLNADKSLSYITRRRNRSERKIQSGSWELLGPDRICIDGDTGIITRFDGRLLEITSSEDDGFDTCVTATYEKQFH